MCCCCCCCVGVNHPSKQNFFFFFFLFLSLSWSLAAAHRWAGPLGVGISEKVSVDGGDRVAKANGGARLLQALTISGGGGAGPRRVRWRPSGGTYFRWQTRCVCVEASKQASKPRATMAITAMYIVWMNGCGVGLDERIDGTEGELAYNAMLVCLFSASSTRRNYHVA